MSEESINEHISLLQEQIRLLQARSTTMEALIYALIWRTGHQNLGKDLEAAAQVLPWLPTPTSDSYANQVALKILHAHDIGVPFHIAFGEEQAEAFSKLRLVWSKKDGE